MNNNQNETIREYLERTGKPRQILETDLIGPDESFTMITHSYDADKNRPMVIFEDPCYRMSRPYMPIDWISTSGKVKVTKEVREGVPVVVFSTVVGKVTIGLTDLKDIDKVDKILYQADSIEAPKQIFAEEPKQRRKLNLSLPTAPGIIFDLLTQKQHV